MSNGESFVAVADFSSVTTAQRSMDSSQCDVSECRLGIVLAVPGSRGIPFLEGGTVTCSLASNLAHQLIRVLCYFASLSTLNEVLRSTPSVYQTS